MQTLFFLALANVVFAVGFNSPDRDFLKYPTTPQRPRLGIHLPLIVSGSSHTSGRAISGSAKVGDYFDLSYTVMVTVGKVPMPLIIETVGGDLEVLSDECTTCNSTNLALYPAKNLVPAGNASVLEGPIGIDTAEIAGIAMPDQYFVLINRTTVAVGVAGSGVIGFGFPAASEVWGQMNNPEDTSGVFKFATFGPLAVRMAASNLIELPMFSLSLQRTTIDLTSSNPGILSIGNFPVGINNATLTWTGLRLYDSSMTSLLDPDPDPNSTKPPHDYPLFWEVFIEGVFFDGAELPSQADLPSTGTSALFDLSLPQIEGPAAVLQSIRDTLNGDLFDCSQPHTLAFKIGGKIFPVDPRDFIRPKAANSTKICQSILTSNEVSIESRQMTSTYSWILGTPFLKGVFTSFYYGNLTHPWVDPPRIGLLSRVPGNAGDLLKEAVRKGVFPNTTEELFTASSSPSSATGVPSPTPSASASVQLSCGWCGWWAILVMALSFSGLHEALIIR